MVKFNLVRDTITPDLNMKKRTLQNVPKEALAVWLKNTPVLTGNAQRRTRLEGTEIVAAYDYAQRLDQGYSPKRPEGMSKPTEQWLKQRLDRLFKG